MKKAVEAKEIIDEQKENIEQAFKSIIKLLKVAHLVPPLKIRNLICPKS